MSGGTLIVKAFFSLAYAWLDYAMPPVPVILQALENACECPTDTTPCDDELRETDND